jgi:GNAT superfamily N-acetyltransferase
LFNCITRARLPLEKLDTTIDNLISEAKKRNVPLMWWTGPATRPSDLADYLEKRGFVCVAQVPGMALDLEKLRDDLPIPSGLSTQRVKDKESLKQWCQVVGTCFEFSDIEMEANCDFMRYIDADKTLPFLGMANNQPVATSLLHLGAGVAGIYCVATIPEARRQGIGAWMTKIPLFEAQRIGYKVSIIHSSEMGLGVYSSLGFQEYCKLGQYMWSSAQEKEEAG